MPKTSRQIKVTAACVLTLCTAAAEAAEWSVEPSVSLRGEHDDNIRLTTAPHESVNGLLLSPRVKLNYETEVALISGGAGLNIRRYSGDSDLDATDTLLNLTGRRKYETGSFGLRLDYIRDSTLGTELQQTGLVEARKQRKSINLTPDWMLQLTERTGLTLGYRYTDVTYQDAQATGLIDYRSHTAFSTLQHKLTERDEASATLSYSRYDPSGISLRFNTTTLLGGYSRLFSETLRGSAALGVAHIASDGLAGGDTSTNRVVGNAGIDKQFETGTLGFRLSRDVNPTGSGSLATTDRAGVELSRRLSETLTLSLAGAAYRTRFVGVIPGSGNSRYYQVEPRLAWQVAREWSLEAGYNYAHVKNDTDPSAATRNLVYVTATYNWPKLAVSR